MVLEQTILERLSSLQNRSHEQDDPRERHSKVSDFNGKDYGWWKARMRIYIQGSDCECWKVTLVQKRQFASDVRCLFASDYGATPKPSTQMTHKQYASYAETTQMVQLFASHLYTVRRTWFSLAQHRAVLCVAHYLRCDADKWFVSHLGLRAMQISILKKKFFFLGKKINFMNRMRLCDL